MNNPIKFEKVFYFSTREQIDEGFAADQKAMPIRPMIPLCMVSTEQSNSLPAFKS